MRDLLDEIEFHMWFPGLNTCMLIAFALFVGIIAIWKVSKLDILWEKFRNIKLRQQMTYKDLIKLRKRV